MVKFVMPYKRKREGRTDYRRRLVLLKSGLIRLVIRASNKSIQAQLVRYEADGDKILATARATDLKKLGWTASCGNTTAAYLTGLLLASKTKTNDDIIIDIGLQQHHKGGRLYAVAKGAIEGGMNVRVGEDVLPIDDRITGAHLSDAVRKQVAAVKAKIKK